MAEAGGDREWLIGLRWGLLGVAAALLAVVQLGAGGLPWLALGGLLAVGAATNVGLWATRHLWRRPDAVVAVTLAGDVAGLTAFLALSGGPNNPFSSLYLLLVVAGALLLPPLSTALLTGSVGLAYAALFALPAPPHDHAAMQRHLQGMWFATAVCGPVLAIAVHQLRARIAAAEARRREAEAAARRTERLASLATLAAGAAHEIASPLGTIAVVAEELSRSGDPGVRSDGELLTREVGRCRAVLQQLAADSGSPRVDGVAPFDLGELVRELVPDAEVDAPAAGLRVQGSARLVAQALRRLLANAERAGGPVEVRVSAEGEALTVSVRDRGPALAPEVRARLGEPFFTTHGGLGLGVWFATDVVRQLGGHLGYEDAAGGGTVARVTLPRGSR
jgi:two-component system sensor histidine kinase RegB